MIELSCEIHRTVRLKRGYNLDKQTFVLYNKIDSISVTTTEYLFSQIDWENGNKPDNACGTLRESTAASELLWTVGSQVSVKDSFDFEFQSRLHECEATTAGDQSILFAGSRYAFVCRLFCCLKAGYNGMTGWMGYDFAKTSCVNRESETTLR